MALTIEQAKKLKPQDVVFTRYVHYNGRVKVTKWRVVRPDTTGKSSPTKVDVKLVQGANMSGLLKTHSLASFYPTYVDALKGDE